MANKSTIYPLREGHVEEVDGRLCYVLTGISRGKRAAVAIPADGLNEVFDDALNRVHVHRVGGQATASSGYQAVMTRPGTPAGAGTMVTTEGQKVILTIRKDTPGEQHLSFSPKDARDLAALLLEEADRAEGKGQTKPIVN